METSTDKIIRKIIDRSSDKEKTAKNLIELLDIAPCGGYEISNARYSLISQHNICQYHGVSNCLSFIHKCHFCPKTGCVRCGDLFKVSDESLSNKYGKIYMCYDCYEPKCAEIDMCYIKDGKFITCHWCLGLGWNIDAIHSSH